MRVIAFAQNETDLDTLSRSPGSEVIFATKELSTEGIFSLAQIPALSAKARELGLKVILDWDVLLDQGTLDGLCTLLKQTDLSCVDGIRVKDLGALEKLLSDFPNLKIQLILEVANHNLLSIQTWIERIETRLDRVVLSQELPRDTLEYYKSSLFCEVEVLLLGRILLFYSPRHLISPLVGEEMKQVEKEKWEAIGNSEESPHKGFPIVQNRHGTFMYHLKDFCLLGEIQDLKEMKIDVLRVDLRHQTHPKLLSKILDYISNTSEEKLVSIKEAYSGEWMRGFYRVNKTDILFPKLKNNRIKRQDQDYLGEVVDVMKEKSLILMVKKGELKAGDKLRFVNPDGIEKTLELLQLKNINGETVDKITTGHLAQIPWLGSMTTRSVAYFLQ